MAGRLVHGPSLYGSMDGFLGQDEADRILGPPDKRGARGERYSRERILMLLLFDGPFNLIYIGRSRGCRGKPDIRRHMDRRRASEGYNVYYVPGTSQIVIFPCSYAAIKRVVRECRPRVHGHHRGGNIGFRQTAQEFFAA